MGGIVQLTLPWAIEFSVTLEIGLQVLRGFLAGVIVPANMEFARKWTFGKETKYFIAALGNIFFIGTGFGPMVAGFLSGRLGWRSFFYISGATLLLVFILQCLLVPENPLDSPLIEGDEMEMFKRRLEAHKSAGSASGKKGMRETPLREIFSRIYPYAFCIFMMSNTIQFYTLMAVTPFYLFEVLNASPDLVSTVQIMLGLAGAVMTNILSAIFIRLDKKLPWLKCRAVMTFVPYTIRCIFIAIIPLFSMPAMVIVCSVVAISMTGAVFSGSLITVNYELDPTNSAFIFSIFSSIAQTSGFTAPLLKSKIVSSSGSTSSSNEIAEIKQEWATFYYIVASTTLLSFVAIILAYMIRKSEWKKHESLRIDENKEGLKVIIDSKETSYSKIPSLEPPK